MRKSYGVIDLFGREASNDPPTPNIPGKTRIIR